MAGQYNRWERFYNKLSMVFHGVVAFSMIPFAWAFLETQKEFPDPPLLAGHALLAVTVGLVVAAGLVVGYSFLLDKKIRERVRRLGSVEEKLRAYTGEKIKFYALLEVAAVAAFAGLYLTKNQLFTVIYLGVLLVFSLARPTYDRIVKELKIRHSEIDEWMKKE